MGSGLLDLQSQQRTVVSYDPEMMTVLSGWLNFTQFILYKNNKRWEIIEKCWVLIQGEYEQVNSKRVWFFEKPLRDISWSLLLKKSSLLYEWEFPWKESEFWKTWEKIIIVGLKSI